MEVWVLLAEALAGEVSCGMAVMSGMKHCIPSYSNSDNES